MTKQEIDSKNNSRGYSSTHEKLIPIALTLLVVIFIGMLVLAAGIAMGWIHAG
ncbi:MAG: hypothetical protein PVI99_08920 [Anaerolineales bacterium]|jgi:hypothetical protein